METTGNIIQGRRVYVINLVIQQMVIEYLLHAKNNLEGWKFSSEQNKQNWCLH